MNCTATAPLDRRAGAGVRRVPTLSDLDRITVDPVHCHGKPTVRGLGMTVLSILELLASEMNLDEVLAD